MRQITSSLLGRLDSDPKAGKEGWDVLVLAAEESSAAAPAAYLRSITVEGFRGVGPSAKLDLQPGPGLTLVVGRNGSGKSSCAEALEMDGESGLQKPKPEMSPWVFPKQPGP